MFQIYFIFTATWGRFPFGQTYFIQWVASTIVLTILRHFRVNCSEKETTRIPIVLFFIVSMRWRNNHSLIHITLFDVYCYIVVHYPALDHILILIHKRSCQSTAPRLVKWLTGMESWGDICRLNNSLWNMLQLNVMLLAEIWTCKGTVFFAICCKWALLGFNTCISKSQR